MDNGKSTALPSPCTPSPYAAAIANLNVKSESSSSPSLVSATTLNCTSFRPDISRMPDKPLGNVGHRRIQSEILTFPDDISFDSDLNIIGVGNDPSFFDDTEEDLISFYLMDKFNSSSDNGALTFVADDIAINTNGMLGVRHRHSQTMNALTTIKSDMLVSTSDDVSVADSRKAMSAAKFAELALINPKRDRRIWANRQPVARSKERKMRYISELERRVQTLQIEAASLSTQLTILQRDTQRLSTENSEMKLNIQTIHQQIHLQHALNDVLRDEIQHLKVLTGQTMRNGGPMKFSSYGRGKQYYPNNQIKHTFLTVLQFQQLQILSCKWLYQFQVQPQQPQLLQQQQFQQQQVQEQLRLQSQRLQPQPQPHQPQQHQQQ